MNPPLLSANEVIAAIHGAYARGRKNGLKNMERLLALLCPSPKVPVIHVAGTNGKGSICAMLESILRHAGYRTGLYTSPFLQAYQERIRLNGEPISDVLLEKYGNPLLNTADCLRAEGIEPTPFELGTALALSVFEGEQVDAAIIEVGMGGRQDPTNIVSPILCGIAAIGLDHTSFLGDTLPEIAGEKAGIIKPGVPVVCHPADAEVEAVFAEAAARKSAPLRQLKRGMITGAKCTATGDVMDCRLEKDWHDLRICLPGAHQLTNALTVLAMAEELEKIGLHLPEKAVREGLAATVWSARLEWCGNVLIDGAHNAQGIAALKTFVRDQLDASRRVLLSGVLSEKLSPEMLRDMAQLADTAFTVTPDTPRAMPADEYASLLRAAGIRAVPCQDLSEGLRMARQAAGEDGVILAAGSLYFAGMLRNELKLGWKHEF